MLQRYVHFVQCIHKTHSQHVKKMQGNIRIVLTLSILKKNTVTTDWIENKINTVYNAYLCFIEFKVDNWSEKKTSLHCFVLFANMSLVLVQFPIPVYINLSRLLQNYL